jgi:DNA modification methylase
LTQTRFEKLVQTKENQLSRVYSGDKPNPNLKAFVEKHVAEHPYNALTDNYDVKAFDKPIQTTKATAIYNMHTYWSKKPHDAIIQYIEHYTKPGDLVLDPMCGSGSTALAALMTGRKAVALDLSPAATFITKNYCTPMTVRELKEGFHDLEAKIISEMNWLYETRCDRCGGKAITMHMVYSKVFQCPRCLEKVPLFDCVDVEVPAKVQTKDQPIKMKKVSVCPHCLKKDHIEEINTRRERFGSIPVLVSYECQGKCKPKRDERRYNDLDPRKREYFEKYDLAKIKEIESKEIPYWYPDAELAEHIPYRMLYKKDFRQEDAKQLKDLFTKRNLWALALLKNKIEDINNDSLKSQFLFIMSSFLLNLTKLYKYRDSGGGQPTGNYYIPQINRENEAWSAFIRKFQNIIEGISTLNINEDNLKNIVISTDNACNLHDILSNSIDYIFTDPPYGGNVQYGELNFVWEAWLGFNIHWFEKEIIVNEPRNITEDDWKRMMTEAMSECFRVLKPGRGISLCYHDTDPKTWQLVQDIMAEVGFLTDKNEKVLFIDTNQKTYNQSQANKVTKRDLIINLRKPKPGEVSAYIQFTGNEELTTFNEKAGTIIRDFLEKHPASTKDHIYDEVISRMVKRNLLQDHNFEDVLRLVAEPNKSLNGLSSLERWYLKGSELDIIDTAETEKEEKASEKIKIFIENKLKKFPELDGIHYSDLFEYYVYTVIEKPRRELVDWLLEYFYLTSEGTYRLPKTSDEEKVKTDGRSRGLNRRIRRFVTYIERGVPVPDEEKPDNATLISWIFHCRRSGLFAEGKLLYERGGLVLDGLSEANLVELDEAYQVCGKMIDEGKKEAKK